MTRVVGISQALRNTDSITFPALRIFGGSDGVEEGPVGFFGVEQRLGLVVGESSEPEAGVFDASGQVVDRTAGVFGLLSAPSGG